MAALPKRKRFSTLVRNGSLILKRNRDKKMLRNSQKQSLLRLRLTSKISRLAVKSVSLISAAPPAYLRNHGDAITQTFARLLATQLRGLASSPQVDGAWDMPAFSSERLAKLLADASDWVEATEATKKVSIKTRLSPPVVLKDTGITPATGTAPATETALTAGASGGIGWINRKWHVQNLPAYGISRPLNTCYRRAALQTLLHAPVFLNWILQHVCKQEDPATTQTQPRQSKRSNMKCLACQLRVLTKVYWAQHRNDTHINQAAAAIDANISILSKKGHYLESADPNIQGDSMEFILWILSYFATHTPSPMPLSQLNMLFQVNLNVRRVCPKCNTKAPPRSQLAYNLILYLARQVNDPTSFQDRMDDLLNDPSGTPGKCQNPQCSYGASSMPEQLRFVSAPEVLLIQLERSPSDPRHNKKNHQIVNIPTTLDLTAYMSAPLKKSDKTLQYGLGAVIGHKGGLRLGHYISWTRSPAGVFEANDTSITASNFEQFAKKNPNATTPVVLMYLRK